MDQSASHQIEQLKKVEEMKKQIFGKILAKEAYERLSRVRAVNPELAGQVELYLLQIYQSGKLKGSVDDMQLKDVLRFLSSNLQKQTTIRRM